MLYFCDYVNCRLNQHLTNKNISIMKKVFLALVAIVVSLSAFAQKEQFAVKDFTYSENVGENYAMAVRNKVLEVIGGMARFEVVNFQQDAAAEASAATYVMDGHVVSITITSMTLDDGTVTYDAKIAYQLKVAQGDKQIGNKTFEASSASLLSSHKTQVDAANAAVNKIPGDLKIFIDEHFKMNGSIVEIAETKKNEAKKLYINLGSDKGIQAKQKFDVMVEKEIAGRKVQKSIGELEVESVEAGDLSLCKVKKGGKEILAAVNEGRTVSCVSKASKPSAFSKGLSGMGLGL